MVFALGFFDGVHVGHQALLAECRQMAQELGCDPGVVTFLGHPDTLVSGITPPLIGTAADRARLLRHYGMERLVELPFDRALMEMPYRTFFKLLVERYHARGLVCGADFRFGARGEGTAEKLADLCAGAGIRCAVVPDQRVDGIRVSSTHIRSLLESGDVEAAARFLGHPHIFTGTVVPGKKLGRTLGIPTANLVIPEGVQIPRFGVYACKAWIDGCWYPAVTNVGVRPTVDGTYVTVEPWLLGFDREVYGQPLTLGFYRFLRPENRFPSLEDLKAAILRDRDETLKTFGKL